VVSDPARMYTRAESSAPASLPIEVYTVPAETYVTEPFTILSAPTAGRTASAKSTITHPSFIAPPAENNTTSRFHTLRPSVDRKRQLRKLISTFLTFSFTLLLIPVAVETVLCPVVRILVAGSRATERRQVAQNGVALAALRPLIPMRPRVDPEILRVMVHRVGCPCSCTVAGRTIMREHLRHVIRIRHLLEIRRMTLIAFRILELIVAVCMTCLTRRGRVRTGKWEVRGVVVERCRTPRRRGVALRTIVAEIPGHVIRIR